MPHTTNLYHGTFYLMDTETGEAINVAMQLAVRDDRATYTIRGLAGTPRVVNIETTDLDRVRALRDLIRAMREASVPA